MIDVDDSNLEEYLELVLDKTLGSGITQQVKAFQEGFSMIFDIADMRIFAPEELGLLIGNADEDWSKESEFASRGFEADENGADRQRLNNPSKPITATRSRVGRCRTWWMLWQRTTKKKEGNSCSCKSRHIRG